MNERTFESIQNEIQREYENGCSLLQERADYHPAFAYFLDLLKRPLWPQKMQETISRPLMEHLCNQAPYEVFHAFGVHPLRIGSGCFSVQRLSASRSPALMCPMIKATMGMAQLQTGIGEKPNTRVLPTTCDWVVKFTEMADQNPADTCFLELPHLRQGEKAQNRWLEEIYALVGYLEGKTGKKLKQKKLLVSIQTFMNAWQVFGEMIRLKRQRRISQVWFMVIANSFMLDAIEPWTEQVQQLIDILKNNSPKEQQKRIFLAGSPIIFPNFKMLHLIEEAGMTICADDLCTSERIWPGAVCYDDPSQHGLIRALSERYHKACACPTFADNDRRVNVIFSTLKQHDIQAVVYHVLKGCHPCDIESIKIEEKMKQEGYQFLKIETDYVREDSQNILTRLEAFKEM